VSEGGEEKKIIIDEDWKSQVQAEKEQLERKKQQRPGAEAEDATETASPGQSLPPATLSTLCTTLAAQAMMSMGQMPNPLTGRAEIHIEHARHYIDTLEMLEKKTEGNRTPEEITLFSQLLHELRLGYIEAQKAVASAAQNVADPSSAADKANG